ncbi:uncharacterized protein PHALS_13252 [Plasmopara halstedii]|uniref:Uncharacterized protein n=1 Tax=Plasmopara halstedii TaxID=4781 RepID=A0A0N7L617_PLAHL|nr:uncharacterized protein PHALS_13252 [Plasmopara halstedii]CEG43027.1 hypothetical protein PHALS_13252 [Plasmopara halstedii]|eukprot:XP_024579396.1 hypothetical protein PHALS_13252 [Plasmopara halstedii]
MMSKHITVLGEDFNPQTSKPFVSRDVEGPRLVRPPSIRSSPTPQINTHRNLKTAFTAKSTRNDNSSSSENPHIDVRESKLTTDREWRFGDKKGDRETVSQFSAEDQAAAILDEIAERKNDANQKIKSLRHNVLSNDKRIDKLQASFEDLICQARSLQELCDSEVDINELDKHFLTIPDCNINLYLSKRI